MPRDWNRLSEHWKSLTAAEKVDVAAVYQREVFGWNYRTMADICRIPKVDAFWRVRRGRQLLDRLLKADAGGER